MTGNEEKVFLKDAKVFKNILIDIVKNVSDEIVLSNGPNGSAIPSQIKRDIRKAVIDTAEERLEYLIEKENIPEKFAFLNESASVADAQPAWRPQTGEIPITTLTGKYTERKKLLFSNKLEKLKQERFELQNEIIQRRKIIEKQIKQVQKCRETQILELQKANADLLKPLYN